METGLLWYDGDRKRTLRDKIERAAERYREKVGVRPNICFVNSNMIEEQELDLGGIRIVTARDVLPNHFWIGVAGPADLKKARDRLWPSQQ